MEWASIVYILENFHFIQKKEFYSNVWVMKLLSLLSIVVVVWFFLQHLQEAG